MNATLQFRHALTRAAAVVLLCVCTGCSGQTSKLSVPRPSVSPPSASATPDENTRATQAALLAYSDMWSDMASAGLTANWKDSALTHHATDRALTQIVQVLYSEQQHGLVSRGAPVLHPEVVQLSPPSAPTSARIKDCGDSTAWSEVDAKTGISSGPATGGHRLILAQVVRSGGLWRVTDFTIDKIGSCA